MYSKKLTITFGLLLGAILAGFLFWSREAPPAASASAAANQPTLVANKDAAQAQPADQTAVDRAPLLPTDTEPTLADRWLAATTIDAVAHLLNEFATQQTAVWHSQAGWFNVSIGGPDRTANQQHTTTAYHGPDGQTVPADQLFPTGHGIISKWYYVNSVGIVEQGLTFTTDAAGKVYQPTFLQGDQWLNLTLKEHGFAVEGYTTAVASNDLVHYLPMQDVLAFLAIAKQSASPAAPVTVHTSIDNGRYQLAITSTYPTPAEMGAPFTEPVVASERRFLFSAEGQLQSDTHTFRLQSGELFVAGEAIYHLSDALLPQLPADVAFVWQQASQTAVGQ